MSRVAGFEAVRARVAAMQVGGGAARGVLPFGDPRLDGVFPAGGLPLGVWHEVAGEGLDIETAAAAGAFVAALAGPLARRGALVWIMRRGDLHAPGLVAFGLPAERLIQVEARNEAQALAALEDALGARGVAAAIGEVGGEVGGEAGGGGLDLRAGRRLQLACERGGATGFVLRRRPFGGRSGKPPAAGSGVGSAAATRWSIAPAPSGPVPGGAGTDRDELGPPRWRVTLRRCRGGRPGAWILEMSDGAYPLRVVAELGDGQLEAAPADALAGRRRAV